MRRVIAGVAGGAFLALVALTAYMNSGDLSPEELARRCADSFPAWQSYQEDIKAQVGARPVAEWKGRPTGVKQAGREIRVTFLLSVPWSGRPAVLPILMRDPLGVVYRNIGAESRAAERIYLFELAETSVVSLLPWIELQFPHSEVRLPLDPQGEWRSNTAQ